MADDTSVRVAVRIRPQLAREKIDNCRVCTSVTPGEPQVVMGNDKAFTFDTVFDTHAGQQEVFEAHAKQLIDGCFDGYNATILAYGQTGSGKTHSMGTGFDVSILEEDMGIIPRAVRHLFTGIMSSKIKAKENTLPEPTFHVYAEFLELYNEDIYDLFDNTNGEGKRSKSNIKIHEDSNGSIYTQGVTLKTVNSYEETMECLQFGALSRTTASTNMNSQSSRSHAIFTLHVKQTRALPQTNMTESTEGEKEVDTSTVEFESLSSKFNFVDLAGSERLKRTGATGDRAKEGISINCGLLALGNVISALGDVCKKGSHVPYRDSKLTRLLQDSLGGNSRTVMIACISPSDRDFMETLNTLKYANRARNIKNRVVVNQDKTSKQLTELRAQVQALQLELVEYKQGKRIVGPDGVESINDMFHENSLLQDENDKLRHRVKVLQETVDHMKSTNESAANDRAAVILSSVSGDNNLNEEVKKLISGYNTELESLRVKLLESEAANKHVKRTTAPPSRLALTPSTPRSMMDTPSEMDGSLDSTVSIIELAKQDVERSKTLLFTKQQSMNGSFPDENTASGGDDSAEADSGEHEADDDLDQSDDDQSESEHSSESDDQSSKGLIYKLPELTATTPHEPTTPEADNEAERIEEDLADLSGEISIKQKMIEELEKSQRQLQTIRQHYEDKLRNLQQQIRDIERERDQVLNTIGDKSKQSEEQVKKVKSEFEKRLSDMQAELSKVSAAKREHSKMMKNQAVYDKKIRELNSELSDMKKTKVRLMSQMKTESEKNKISDQKKNRELLQLRKEKRMRDSQLKQLEMQNRQKDAILKRKHEEVSQLRRKQRETSASARVMAKNRVNSTQRNGSPRVSRGKATPAFSAKVAKSKWDKLEHYISSVIMRKQTITSMESEMDLFIDKREGLSKKIERYTHKLETAMQVDDIELATDLEDQLETMNINMNYIQSNVAECQNNIIQMEAEAKDESVLEIVLDSISLDEARYLLEHLVSLTLSKGYDFTQKDIAYKELTACFEKLQMDSKLSNQLLQQMLVDSGLSMQESAEFDTDELSGENCNSNRSSPIYGLEGTGDQMWAELTYRHKDKSRRKARRRTATPSDLLGTNLSDTSTPPQSPLVAKPTFNIADIIPPAPKGPPPGRGMPHPLIGTIQEEPEDEDFFSPKTQLLRSGSYTVLNSTISNKPHINDTMACPPINLPDGDSSDEDVPSSRGSPSTDFECSKTRSGSYTIISGEIRFDSSQTNTKTTDCTTSRETTPSQEEIIPDRLKQGSITQNASIVGEMIAEFSQPAVNSSGEPGATSHKSNKIPPKVPPKPHRPSSLNPSSPSSTSPITPSPINSQNMSKWKGFISNHLDSEDDQRPITDSKPPLPNSVPVSVEPRDSTGRVIGRRKMAPPNASPALRRKMFNAPTSNTQNNSTRPPAEVLQPSATPPSSPSLRRKQLGSAPDVSDSNNVFMRLTSYSSGSQTAPKRGSMPGLINNSSEKSSSSNQTMTCVKQASGHTKGVLSVCVTEDLLITGSKDQSSKVWDLHLCAELMSLDDHPNYVTRVRYCDNNKLVYSVSNSFIKVWDIRSRGKCIKVLSSSGQVRDSIPHEPSSSSQPFIQSGEQQIFDMWVGGVGDSHSVYSTTGSTVRVWDIRMFNTTMKVASGHQAPIKCLTLHNPPSGLELVTGSKDHFIKLFDLNSDSGGVIQPKHTLSPPHYDGVECLTQRGDALFSGSRDMSIKMWSLSDCSLQQTVNGAHKDWVLDMCLLPDNDILASACRSGTVKLWSSETCSLIDEIRAHTQSVNGLAANSSHLFTASSDNTVGLWKVTSS